MNSKRSPSPKSPISPISPEKFRQSILYKRRSNIQMRPKSSFVQGLFNSIFTDEPDTSEPISSTPL